MKLPIGMLIYWAHRDSDELSVISGMWYYKELYVPSTIHEKKQSSLDLKNKRCTILNVSGTYNQILDLLMQCDKFQKNGTVLIDQFDKLNQELIHSKDKPIIFDDIYNLKGSALSLDTVVDVDQEFDEIMQVVNAWKEVVTVTISDDWSFAKDVLEFFKK